jgi:hypothetical protein
VAEEIAGPERAFYRHGDVFHARSQELEREEFMRGEARGRLAVALDVLTDALILVGQHGVYCAKSCAAEDGFAGGAGGDWRGEGAGGVGFGEAERRG